MRLALGLLALPLLVAVAAFVAALDFGSPPLVTDLGVVFPKGRASSKGPSEDVAGGGVLVVDYAGCLRVGTGRGPEAVGRTDTVPIWPRDFDLALEGGDILIVDAEGEKVARVGDEVEMNGAPTEEGDPQPELVERCPGDYFTVGNTVHVVRRQGVPVASDGGVGYGSLGEAKEARENNQYRDNEDRDGKARAKLEKTKQWKNENPSRQYRDRLR